MQASLEGMGWVDCSRGASVLEQGPTGGQHGWFCWLAVRGDVRHAPKAKMFLNDFFVFVFVFGCFGLTTYYPQPDPPLNQL